MKILSIETSCDETAAAIIENGKKILSSIVASSEDLHEKTGGIIPETAAREQIKTIIPVINEVLFQISNIKYQISKKSSTNIKDYLNKIDAIAVTIGPGLIGSLLVGVETAKTLSYVAKKPIVPVNHIFAHIYANWLETDKIPVFPALALVVSGGHTELFLLQDHGEIKWIGGTLDDAAGEAFDKTARLLGLGFPGGPEIAAQAAKFKISRPKADQPLAENTRYKIQLPRPMMDQDNLNFSFSGLKTAVLREVEKLKTIKSRRSGIHDAVMRKNLQTASGKINNNIIQQLSYEIQESITDVLVEKTLKAAKEYKVKSILLGGGVAANQRLAEKFSFKIKNLKFKIALHIPPAKLCTDNAAYIGSYAYFNFKPIPWSKIQAEPSLSVEV